MVAPPPSTSPGVRLSVGTLNVWGVWADWPARRAALAAAWPAPGPDVLALQEVVVGPGVDQVTEVAALLGYEHRSWVAGHEDEGGIEGIALLSRLPLGDRVVRPLPESVPPRRTLEVTVRAGDDGPGVRVRCAHTIGPPGPVRTAQVEALLAMPCDGPTVLLGDLNMDPVQVDALLPPAGVRPAVPADAPATWPMDPDLFAAMWEEHIGHAPHFPLAPRRIDHVLVSGVRAERSAVVPLHDGERHASDHALVVACLVVDPSVASQDDERSPCVEAAAAAGRPPAA